jgi:ParB-like chromosome segregation protein Spo0J
MDLTINQELRSLIPALTPEEYAQLEANILLDGCHDPLIVWQQEQTILDGHNRHAICEKHGLPYTTIELPLPTLEAAKAWMIDNQLLDSRKFLV